MVFPRHYLRPLLAPRGVALVGATERAGALGDIVWRNLAAAGLKEPLYPVNPKHATVGGSRAYARLTELPEKPDLAVVLTPTRAVPGVVRDAGRAEIKAAVVLSSGFAEAGADGAKLQAEMLEAARAGGVRVLGPNCVGLMRTDLGLNATFARTYAHVGKLALVSQSGALCGAILEWANSLAVGFSSVVSLGGAADVDFGEVLDFLAVDPATDAILLYIEGIHDARRFLSALRATARVKPVIALKVGRYASGGRAASSHAGALVGGDAVLADGRTVLNEHEAKALLAAFGLPVTPTIVATARTAAVAAAQKIALPRGAQDPVARHHAQDDAALRRCARGAGRGDDRPGVRAGNLLRRGRRVGGCSAPTGTCPRPTRRRSARSSPAFRAWSACCRG